MHEFYKRIETVMERAGSNRSKFCRDHGYKYQTLQAYWNTDRLPPGNVLEDLAREYDVSLDVLVLGRSPPEISGDNPTIRGITKFLAQQDEKNLLRIEGAIKMLQYMSLSGPDDSAKKLDSLTNLLTSLGQLIQQSNLSPQEKESGRRILNRIVLSFERQIDIDDDWAELEEI